jgi:ABC-type ATPase involved in cell division
MGNLLDRKKLLEKEKLQIEKVELENGDFVFVRQMTGRERDTFEQSLLKKNKNDKGQVVSYEQSLDDFRAKLAVVTLCDEEGKSLLLPTDYNMLSMNMSAKTLETIVNIAQKLNKITEEDKEELVKNSSAGLVDSSSSGSAEN